MAKYIPKYWSILKWKRDTIALLAIADLSLRFLKGDNFDFSRVHYLWTKIGRWTLKDKLSFMIEHPHTFKFSYPEALSEFIQLSAMQTVE
jgi:hypothetical protein